MTMIRDKFHDDMSDDEIRILGSGGKANNAESSSHRKKGRRYIWITTICIAVLSLISLACVFLLRNSNSGPTSKDKIDSLSEETIRTAAKASKCIISKQDTTINDIPLIIIIPKGGQVNLYIGKLPKNDKSIVLAAQAADVRDDKDLPTGAFVCNGELISKGHSKYGFCAILSNTITLGRQNETPLFEKAVEENGSFFRQYSLVSNGKLMEIPPKGKALRRALCLYNKQIVIIESKDRESYHDFSQSLVDLGVKEALALVGGDGVMMFRQSDGKTIIEGTPLSERKMSENYIIWK